LTAYYNEHDPFAAEWLRELIKAGHIAPGVVDERSIEDVVPNELIGFTQCHFFAGIGGWSLALRLAGWSDDKAAWTGSCPCQPFSAAGKGAGFADERHLWPAFFHLIKECGPVIVFGEQVASKDTNPWFDLIQADLEQVGYAFGCVPFAAAGVGAPHIRERAYWVADHNQHGRNQGRQGITTPGNDGIIGSGTTCGVADMPSKRLEIRQRGTSVQAKDGKPQRYGDGLGRPGPINGQWRDADWLFCRDGKWRPVEPGTFPLASGVSNRVGLLRGYGNSIVPAQAAEFIKAYFGV